MLNVKKFFTKKENDCEMGMYLTFDLCDYNQMYEIENYLKKNEDFEQKIYSKIITGNCYYKELGAVYEKRKDIKRQLNKDLKDFITDKSINIRNIKITIDTKDNCIKSLKRREKYRACLHEAAHWAVAEYLKYKVKKVEIFCDGGGAIHPDYMKDKEFAITLRNALKHDFNETSPNTIKMRNLLKSNNSNDFWDFIFEYLKIHLAGELYVFLYDTKFKFKNGNLALNGKEDDIEQFTKITSHFGFNKDVIDYIFNKTISIIIENKGKIKARANKLIKNNLIVIE